MAAIEAERDALVDHVEKMSRPPSDSELQTKVTTLEREKRVLINRNSRLAQEYRELEDRNTRLEADNNALQDEVESLRERVALQTEVADTT